MRSGSLLLLVVLASGCAHWKKPGLAFCPPAAFANCTQAKCVKKADNSGYTCTCFEDNRYSATVFTESEASSCVAATNETLQSRYHPVESYQECTSPATDTHEWAWCLGVSCQRGNDGPQCDCTAVPKGVPLFPYIVTRKTYSAEACRLGLTGFYWSSATPTDVTQVTAFLQKQPGLGNVQQPLLLTQPVH